MTINKPVCYVLVGLPALGKSTFAKTLVSDRGVEDPYWIYSTDMYIDAIADDNGITYNEAFEDNIKAATEYNNKRLDIALTMKKDIIWDQTNVGAKKRKKIAAKMKKAGYEANCICVMPPDPKSDTYKKDCDEWANRLQTRPGKVIPTHAILNMINSYTEPTEEEGFDLISFYDMYGKWKKAV